jgi:hypothetical protein
MSEKYIDPARHEPADVGRRFIWAGSALVLVSVFISGLIVLWLYPGTTTDPPCACPCRAIQIPSFNSIQPRTWRGSATRKCDSLTNWVGKENRIAQIPVADAMRKIAQKNIPAWPRAAEPPVARKNALASPAPAEQPHEAQETVPSSPASTEKANAAARSHSASSPSFAVAASAPDFSGIAYEQWPGAQIPIQDIFRDDTGRIVRLDDLFEGRPLSLRLRTSVAPIFAASFAPTCSRRSARPE